MVTGSRDTDGGWDTVEPPLARGASRTPDKQDEKNVRIGSAMQKFILIVSKAAPFVLTPLPVHPAPGTPDPGLQVNPGRCPEREAAQSGHTGGP